MRVLSRLSRRQVWTLVGVAWIVAAGSTVAILIHTNRLISIAPRDGPPADLPRADRLVGSWSWESINPNVRYVETFAEDGRWTLSVKGFTPKTPTSAWWKSLGGGESHCLVLFCEGHDDETGPLREFVFEGPDTLRELRGDMLNLKRYTRVKDSK